MKRIATWLLILGAIALAFFWWRSQTVTPSIQPTGSLETRQVLLIPGYGGDTGSLSELREGLQGAGYTVTVVDIGDGGDPIQTYAERLANQITSLGGAHLIGYSQGGLIARAATVRAPAFVGRVITVGTPNKGTALAGAGAQFAAESCDAGCQDMIPGSEFLSQLPNAEGTARWLAIRTSTDNVVRPPSNAILEGATNLELESVCPSASYDHSTVATSQATVSAAIGFLQTGIALPPFPCP